MNESLHFAPTLHYGVTELLSFLSDQPQSVSALARLSRRDEAWARAQLLELRLSGAPIVEVADSYALAPGTPAPKLLRRRGQWGQQLRYLPQVDSTQREMVRWAAQGAEHGAVAVAEQQLQGRGRRGKAWDSQAGNLMFSVLLRPEQLSLPLPLTPLACGVALREACGLGQLKWPNDLLSSDGRKLAGLLLEVVWQGGQPKQLVLGVGVNVRSAPQGAAALNEFIDVTPAQLLIGVLWQLERWLTQSPEHALAAWRAHARLGQEVNVQTARETLCGRALDIDAEGALLLETASGLRRVTGGDVQLIGNLSPLGFRAARPEDARAAAPLKPTATSRCC